MKIEIAGLTLTLEREAREEDIDPFYANLPPDVKLDVLRAMGFIAFWEEHQPDCQHQYDRGIRCNCVPPGTSWRAPRDVIEHMGETWDKLRERKRSHG